MPNYYCDSPTAQEKKVDMSEQLKDFSKKVEEVEKLFIATIFFS